MSRIRLFMLCALCLALLAPPSSADGPGVLEGRVVNGTAGGASVEGMSVELRTFQARADGGSVEGERLQTDADTEGEFRFEGLSVADVYQVVAGYSGVVYSSPALRFEPGSERIDTELFVYETTTDDSTSEVSRAHLLVSPAQAGVAVTELYVLVNSGDRTYVGQQEVQGRLWTSSYQLPEGARDVVFEDGAWGGRFLETKGGLVDTEPLWPGQTTVIFAYNIDCPSGSCDLGRALQQRVANLNVLVPDTGVTVSSKTLRAQGTMDAQGRSYLNFAASDLAPASRLDLAISWGQSAPFAAPVSVAASASVLPWIILGTVIMVVVLGYPFWRRRVQEQALHGRARAPRRPDDER